MTDRPILFSAPMVRALLEGRKTQTRRIMKPQPELSENGTWHVFNAQGGTIGVTTERVPLFGPDYVRYEVGDRLWVRETWAERIKGEAATYRADVPDLPIQWKPSIFMPRWASRLTLVVTDVRVERLQNISEADAIAEGVIQDQLFKGEPAWRSYENSVGSCAGPVCSYMTLWDSINSDPLVDWDANPWVVALSFAVVLENIDEGKR